MTRALRLAAVASLLALTACAGRSHPLPSVPNAPLPPAPILDIPVLDAAPERASPASLYSPGRAGLFTDLRARNVGDILTVRIDIDDQAQLDNSTSRARRGQAEFGMDGLFGLEAVLDRAFADRFDPANAVGVSGGGESEGEGAIQRRENINLKIAVIVQQRLANGHLLVAGRQQVGVNGETRELLVAGLVRPEDIGSDNTIDYDKVAEARLSYGGRGVITAVQGPRWGQRAYDAAAPF